MTPPEVQDQPVSDQPRAELNVGVLGPLVVATGGVEQALGGQTPRLLVQRLIIASGRMVPIGVLLDDVWAEDPPDSAAATVQAYRSRLHAVVEPGIPSRNP